MKHAIEDADVVINATSVGLHKNDASPLPAAFLPKKKILIFDLIYGRQTKFLEQAKKTRHRTLSGENMLLYQGAKAFEIWTKRKAPISIMRKALYDAVVAH